MEEFLFVYENIKYDGFCKMTIGGEKWKTVKWKFVNCNDGFVKQKAGSELAVAVSIASCVANLIEVILPQSVPLLTLFII